MENNVMLGAIDRVDVPVAAPSGSSSMPIVITTGPIDQMVTLPVDDQSSGSFQFLPGGPAGGGGDVGIDFKGDVPVEVPSDTTETPAPMSKKNLLLFGIGGLVLAYLLFRKK